MGPKIPGIAQSWRRHWSEVIPFYAFPDEVRRIIYTTNAIESFNANCESGSRPRHFPTDESALKLLFLVLTWPKKMENAAAHGPCESAIRDHIQAGSVHNKPLYTILVSSEIPV